MEQIAMMSKTLFGRINAFLGSVGLMLGFVSECEAQGHRVMGSQVVIETQRHWEGWEFAQGTLQLEGGEVSPSAMRRDLNAVFDIVDFLTPVRCDTSAAELGLCGHWLKTL